MLNNLSVIIPVGPDEDAWKDMLIDIAKLPEGVEVLFVCSNKNTELSEHPLVKKLNRKNLRFILSSPGRAQRMNVGAKAASREFLWFLHADSRFSISTIDALQKSIEQVPEALHYFDLRFLGDGPPLMALNGIGANIRSRMLGIPFGDQGFCIAKRLFAEIGGFPENAQYGEDHLFVWGAKKHKIPVKRVKSEILTSARKYKRFGWFNTTAKHQYLWVKQAFPELFVVMKTKLSQDNLKKFTSLDGGKANKK